MEFALLAADVGGKCITRGSANPPPIPNLFFIMQFDDDVAVRVQRSVRGRRDHARRIVFLDDAGPFAWRREIRPVDDRRLAPPELGTEIDAPLPAGATGPRAIDVQGFRNPRPIREAEADDAQAHDLDGLVVTGLVSIRPLMLAPEGFLDAFEESPVERTAGDRHRQLERLALVSAVRRAADADRVLAEPFGGELRTCLRLHAPVDLAERGGLQGAHETSPRAHVVVL